MSSRMAAGAALALAALVIASPARSQVCEGLPFRGTAAAAATYTSGDAADGPYSVRQYGGALVHQLPGWSPLGTHQVVRLTAAAGQATWHSAPRVLPATRFDGRQASAGIGYTLDALSNSAVGSYVVCASAALEGQYWRVGGASAGGATLPLWLSFGLPLGPAAFALVPHAGFGAYARAISGRSPEGDLRPHGLSPWAAIGLGLAARGLSLDGSLRHEFHSRQRLVVRAGVGL